MIPCVTYGTRRIRGPVRLVAGIKRSSESDAFLAFPVDIDGIKISSDSEGGATKRSYNYRVRTKSVLTAGDMRLFLCLLRRWS